MEGIFRVSSYNVTRTRAQEDPVAMLNLRESSHNAKELPITNPPRVIRAVRLMSSHLSKQL